MRGGEGGGRHCLGPPEIIAENLENIKSEFCRLAAPRGPKSCTYRPRETGESNARTLTNLRAQGSSSSSPTAATKPNQSIQPDLDVGKGGKERRTEGGGRG